MNTKIEKSIEGIQQRPPLRKSTTLNVRDKNYKEPAYD
jgi:hypothetical protein